MSGNGGVGVYVRQLGLGEFSEIACAAEPDSFQQPLSHIPPPRCCARHTEPARAELAGFAAPAIGYCPPQERQK